MEGFRDAALILAAHGSTVNADSAMPTWHHADRLRRRGGFQEVTVAFVQQEPSILGALRRITSRRVFVVPFFISEGWFSQQVVPIQLGLREVGASDFSRIQERDGRLVHFCEPVGSHPGMTGVVAARAHALLVNSRPDVRPRPDPRRTALVIAGHGTTYARGSRESIHRQVNQIRDRGDFAEVFGVFLEETPAIEEAWSLGDSPDRVVVPFFLSDGLHTREDIPRRLGLTESEIRLRLGEAEPAWRNPMEQGGRRLWYGAALGMEDLMTEVIVGRVEDAAAWGG